MSNYHPSFSMVAHANTGSCLLESGIVGVGLVYSRMSGHQEADGQSKDFEGR